jgi:small-conductance mechanosensitive channel
MDNYIKNRYDKIVRKLDALETLAIRASNIMLAIAVLALFLSPGLVAFADEGSGGTDDAAMTFIDIFNGLGKLAIKVCYALMFIVFAVGSVKSGLGAQAAQAFGATGRVSMEMLNLVGGIVIFVIGLMTLPIVNTIIDSISSKLAIDSNIGTINNPVTN